MIILPSPANSQREFGHCLHYLGELRANCELMRAHIRAAVLEDSSQTAVPRVPKNEDN